jgi:hypothetical protein
LSPRRVVVNLSKAHSWPEQEIEEGALKLASVQEPELVQSILDHLEKDEAHAIPAASETVEAFQVAVNQPGVPVGSLKGSEKQQDQHLAGEEGDELTVLEILPNALVDSSATVA